MTKKKLASRIRELKELKAEEASIQDRIASIENEVKAEMMRLDKQELQVDIFTVRYKDLVRKTFDAKTFQGSYTALYEKFMKPTSYKRLTIS